MARSGLRGGESGHFSADELIKSNIIVMHDDSFVLRMMIIARMGVIPEFEITFR